MQVSVRLDNQVRTKQPSSVGHTTARRRSAWTGMRKQYLPPHSSSGTPRPHPQPTPHRLPASPQRPPRARP
eukprot:17236-Eustigmatos_ZCMA.PRE.1